MHENTRGKREKLIRMSLGHYGAKLCCSGYAATVCRNTVPDYYMRALAMHGNTSPARRASTLRGHAPCASVRKSP